MAKCIICTENQCTGPICPDCLGVLRELVTVRKRTEKQHTTHKLVRMADGSRRWIANAEAEKVLALPVNERK